MRIIYQLNMSEIINKLKEEISFYMSAYDIL